MTLTAAAHCIRCDWTAAASDLGTADRAAEAHTRTTGHPTATVARPADVTVRPSHRSPHGDPDASHRA